MSPVTVARGTMMDMLSIAREDAAARFDARQHTTESGDSSHVIISPRRQRRADVLFVMGGRTEHRPDLHTADRCWSAAHCVASDALPKRRRRRIPQSGSLSHHSLGRLTGDGFFRTAQHRFYRAGESDNPPWNSCVGSSDLGDGAAVPTASGLPGVVARVLSFCAASRLASSAAGAAARTRGQTIGTTLSAADPSDGS
jgi:hypothetical protein